MQKKLNLAVVDNSRFQSLSQSYKQLVSYWNSIINIVSTNDVDNLLTTLISQSVKPLEYFDLPDHARVLDIGSGAGIPALPLKFARQDLQLFLLEPQRKKWLFLCRAVEEFHLSGVIVERLRLEEAALRPDWLASFDLITTRATGSALNIYPQAKPLLRPGGVMWFYKGQTVQREAEALQEDNPQSIQILDIGRHLNLLVVQP